MSGVSPHERGFSFFLSCRETWRWTGLYRSKIPLKWWRDTVHHEGLQFGQTDIPLWRARINGGAVTLVLPRADTPRWVERWYSTGMWLVQLNWFASRETHCLLAKFAREAVRFYAPNESQKAVWVNRILICGPIKNWDSQAEHMSYGKDEARHSPRSKRKWRRVDIK